MKPGDGVDGRAGRIPVGDHFKALARNKYWWLTLGLNFALWTYNGMAAYIAKYVLGNSNLIAVIGLATVIPMVIGLPFAGPLVARFGKRNASMAGLVLVAVAVCWCSSIRATCGCSSSPSSCAWSASSR